MVPYTYRYPSARETVHKQKTIPSIRTCTKHTVRSTNTKKKSTVVALLAVLHALGGVGRYEIMIRDHARNKKLERVGRSFTVFPSATPSPVRLWI